MQEVVTGALNVAWPIVLSGLVGSIAGLWTYRQQSKERLSAAVTWQWAPRYQGGDSEEPYLAVQNSNNVPAYLVSARILKGCFIKRQAIKYAFAYDDVTDGNFPLEIKAASVTLFPLAKHQADKIAKNASRLTQFFGHLKRPYIWLELRTIGGRKLVIPANDATSFQDRPKWLRCG